MADTSNQLMLGAGLTVLSHPMMYVKVLVQESEQKDGSTSLDLIVKETTQEMVARSAAALVTHPLHVITLRCMVQFIGRETKYSGLFGSIATIYREEGILGFFAGFIPRLLGDISSLWICNMAAYLINKYALENGAVREMKSYSRHLQGKIPIGESKQQIGFYRHSLFLASILTYPFVLVSNIMAVNNCGLAGGLPPYAAAYTSWTDCWTQLSKEGNINRGNSLFFRKVPAGKSYVVAHKRFY